jgi:hypothetical protein
MRLTDLHAAVRLPVSPAIERPPATTVDALAENQLRLDQLQAAVGPTHVTPASSAALPRRLVPIADVAQAATWRLATAAEERGDFAEAVALFDQIRLRDGVPTHDVEAHFHVAAIRVEQAWRWIGADEPGPMSAALGPNGLEVNSELLDTLRQARAALADTRTAVENPRAQKQLGEEAVAAYQAALTNVESYVRLSYSAQLGRVSSQAIAAITLATVQGMVKRGRLQPDDARVIDWQRRCSGTYAEACLPQLAAVLEAQSRAGLDNDERTEQWHAWAKANA